MGVVMWQRDETRPTTYSGIRFRSGLEARVAEALDDFGALWLYEEPSGYPVNYLPDFTIIQATTDLELPQWVEVKPADLLYAIRDRARLDERFEEPVRLDLTSSDLSRSGFGEAAKPKALAEASGQSVLVVSALNRHRTIAAIMAPDHMVLTRSHPAVCWKQVLKDADRERERIRWEAEAEQRRLEREAEDLDRRRQIVEYARANGRPARFGGACWICHEMKPADDLIVFHNGERWGGTCRVHLDQVEVAQ